MIYSIAVDGPSGAGKSSIAKAVSKKLHIAYLDTGAMYRAVALYCIENNVDVHNEKEVAEALEFIKIDVEWHIDGQITKVKGVNVTDKIRNESVGSTASVIAGYKCVRDVLVKEQRELASHTSIIVDGRDIGTNVLPNATVKLYLDASVDKRAERRYEEIIKSGVKADYSTIKNDIITRDEKDKNREIAPLRMADNAIYIDSSELTLNQVIERILYIINDLFDSSIEGLR